MFIPLSLILLLLNICLYPSPWFYSYWTYVIHLSLVLSMLKICLYPSPGIYSYWTYVYTPLHGSSLIKNMRIPDCTEYHQLWKYERVRAQSALVSEHQVRVTKPQVRVIIQISRVKWPGDWVNETLENREYRWGTQDTRPRLHQPPKQMFFFLLK